MAAHADESLKLMADASEQEKDILKAFRFSENRVILHSDFALCQNESELGLQNYMSDEQEKLCATYWMNRLQHIDVDPFIYNFEPHI